jgi:hypothetical protein
MLKSYGRAVHTNVPRNVERGNGSTGEWKGRYHGRARSRRTGPEGIQSQLSHSPNTPKVTVAKSTVSLG